MSTPSDGASVFNDEEWRGLIGLMQMSRQQGRIIWCLSCGMGDKEIATTLGITPSTVRTHLDRIFTKTGVDDRVKLVLLLVREFRKQCRELPCPRHYATTGVALS
jgi:DNA-binding NarL/FixJ family response regulator